MNKKKPKKSELAFEGGYIEGSKNTRELIIAILNKMIEEENHSMELNPRQTKFLEIRLQALEDFKEKLIYNNEDRFLD